MPEGAEVKAVAVALYTKLCGKWLKAITINSKSRYAKVGGIEKVEKLGIDHIIRETYVRVKN